MRDDCLILAVFVVGCVLFLHIGCQEQAEVAEEPKPVLAVPKPAITLVKAETVPDVNDVNEPAIAPVKAETAPDVNDVNEPAPKITIEEVVYDFGEIGPKSNNSCEFKFTNTGDGLLKIGKIETCCGFTAKLKENKKDYAPGESGTVIITFSASRFRGALTKYQYVNSNDKVRPRVRLTVKAKIVPKVDYEPKRLNLLLKDENAGCPEITLTSLDNQPFAIKQFKSTADSITVDVDYSVKATKFVLQPKVDIEKLRKGLNGLIDISLTHPECDKVTIPFSVLPKFKVSPPSIVVFNAKPQESIRREVWILDNYGEDFEVESALSTKGIIKVLSQEKKDNRYQFELEITPPAAEDKPKIFTDVLIVNIKGGEKLKITCRGFYSRGS